MTVKTVREMSAFQRRRHSLNFKTFFITLLLTFSIGLAVLVVGFFLYLTSVVHSNYTNTWNLANAEAVILEDEDVKGKCDEILSIYDSFTEEERGDGKSAAYHASFDRVMDDSFWKMQTRMHDLKERNGPLNSFIVAIDLDTQKMIYLIDSDPDPETFVYPGTWDIYKLSELKALVEGRKVNGVARRMGVHDRVQAAITNVEPYGPRCTGGTTLYTTDKYTVMVCVDEKLNQIQTATKVFLMQYVGILLIIILGASYIGMLLMRRNLVKPINTLEEAARRYGSDEKKLESGVRYFDDLNIQTGDEIEKLALTMKEMEQELAIHIDKLTRVAAEEERINTELSLGVRIQKSMLPTEFPAFPERDEIDVYASMQPAKIVGGDFYDFALIDEDHLVVEIADVSGKGIPGALFMMATKILLASEALKESSPAKILESVNEIICSRNEVEMFVTVWLGILEISTGNLTTASAGHEYPVWIHADGRAELVHDKHGFVIGGMEGMTYTDHEMQLEKGDRIFVYTDGVTEATSAEMEMFGTERMLQAVGEAASEAGTERVLQGVSAAIERFVGENERFDDLTMLCLEYRGPQGEDRTGHNE